MDFRFSEEEEGFRSELKGYLDKNVTQEFKDELAAQGAAEAGGASADTVGPHHASLIKKMYEDGWATPGWPKEYGGMGMTGMKAFVFSEEISKAGIQIPGGGGMGLIGNTIYRVGSDEQKEEWLPKIMNGEVSTILGYSEPGAGTDLAGLATRAVQDGDEYVINGQKIFNSGAHRGTHEWLLARTDPEAPKHRGLSVFLVPMSSPGITVRPLYTMGDGRTNETFFDNVRVPVQNLIGEKNRGWYHVAIALDFERVSIGGQYVALKGQFDRMVGYAKNTAHNGGTVSQIPWVRDKLAWVGMQLEAVHLFTYRTAWMVSAGLVPNYEASASKILGTEIKQHIADIGMEIMGLHGLLKKGDKRAQFDGEQEKDWRNGIFLRFGGGANEAQRDIIARRGLGLPR
jgi:alkylation response protein AidB-like acyl-CoA dehydrogenase